MQISVSDAKARLTELLRRAEAGEDIVLTRHGQPPPGSRPSWLRKTGKRGSPILRRCAKKTGPGRRLGGAARHPGISFSARIACPNDRAAQQGFVHDTGERRLYPL